MKIEHLFHQIFNLNKGFIFRAGVDVPKPEVKETKLTDAERQTELIALAERHIANAQQVVKEAEDHFKDRDLYEDYQSFARTNRLTAKMEEQFKDHPQDRAQYVKKFEYLIAVKRNIAELQNAIRTRSVTLGMLQESQKSMKKNVGEGLKPLIERGVGQGDPVAAMFTSYSESSADAAYSTEIGTTLTVQAAQENLLRHNLAYSKHSTAPTPAFAEGTMADRSYTDQYNRELAELAAARQLMRSRGERVESDATLGLAQEVCDAFSLYDAAAAGRYNQERPDAILRRRALVTDRLLRQTGALSLKAGQYKELGMVSIQKASSKNAYLLTIGEGTLVDGEPTVIPRTLVIDMDYEGNRSSLESGIAAAQKKGDTDTVQKLEAQYSALTIADPRKDFPNGGPNDAESVTSRVADRMLEQRYGKKA